MIFMKYKMSTIKAVSSYLVTYLYSLIYTFAIEYKFKACDETFPTTFFLHLRGHLSRTSGLPEGGVLWDLDTYCFFIEILLLNPDRQGVCLKISILAGRPLMDDPLVPFESWKWARGAINLLLK